jgi:formylglycine-generating enzyme required for sulfatase activity
LWTKPDAALVLAIQSAQGLFDDQGRFAVCETMPLAEFERVAGGLRKSGYRPVRLRPYADGGAVKVAAVWTRDGRESRMETGLSAGEMREQDKRYGREKLVPVDVAGYIDMGVDGKPIDRYAALWVKAADGDDARMVVGATLDQEQTIRDEFNDEERVPQALQVLHLPDGSPRVSGVWVRPAADGASADAERELSEGRFAAIRARKSDKVLIDVSVDETSRARPWRERVQAVRDLADKALGRRPGNLDATKIRAGARLRLGDDEKALADLNVLVGMGQDDPEVLLDRAITRARLGRKKEAGEDLSRFQQSYTPDDSKLAAVAIVAAACGEGIADALGALDAALEKRPSDADLRREAARAFAMASKAIAARDQAAGRRRAERALRLLQDLVQEGSIDLAGMDDDPALDPIRVEPGFLELLKRGHPERRYSAVWMSDPSIESEVIESGDPAKRLERAPALMKAGYRPVAWSAARTAAGGSLVSASVWHRPVISEPNLDKLAHRKARAAVALVRLGKGEIVWPLLQLSPDPRLRSFIINGLKPMGVEPKLVADAFVRIDGSTRRDPSRSEAESVLFDRDTSILRALILALGMYRPDGFAAADRSALGAKLHELHQSDPDAGIHGAAEWVLRQWNEKLETPDAGLRTTAAAQAARRWFVNSQGQTFAIVDGPDEFRMGSPGPEPNRSAEDEIPHRISIPRRFAIAFQEVTVKQFQEFVRTHDVFKVQQSYLKRYTTALDGPWIAPNWYAAAAYCNWLSEREHIPQSEWAYRPNDSGAYAEGMRIPANVLTRSGYRLPTEAEWEYAGRAGAVTSRYYGLSDEFLGKYAWYSANSDGRARGAGELIPNDLGLFDMLGNAYEWCQDRSKPLRPVKQGRFIDGTVTTEIVTNRYNRVFRGASCVDYPNEARSAARFFERPSYESTSVGFRLARTLKSER